MGRGQAAATANAQELLFGARARGQRPISQTVPVVKEVLRDNGYALWTTTSCTPVAVAAVRIIKLKGKDAEIEIADPELDDYGARVTVPTRLLMPIDPALIGQS